MSIETGRERATKALIEIALELLEDPQALYLNADEQYRRMLNQAIFYALYVQEDTISGHDLKEPFASLHALQDARQGTPHRNPPLRSPPQAQPHPFHSACHQTSGT